MSSVLRVVKHAECLPSVGNKSTLVAFSTQFSRKN